MSPSDCSSGDVCCGTIPITGGTVPNCNTDPITIQCDPANSCKTNLGGLVCSGTKTVRLCKTNADCTEAGDTLCCTFSGGGDGGGSLTFCANLIVAGTGGGNCQ